MSSLSTLGARIDELESRLAFQDDTIESLNQVVARQDAELRSLKLELRELSGRLKELNDAAPESDPGHEPPPHY